MGSYYHPYHMVNQSPWPLVGALGALVLTSGMIQWFHLNVFYQFLMGMLLLLLTCLQWWRDIHRESTFQGHHTSYVVSGLQLGMILFITSEVLFFVSFFWAFFHSSLSPTVELGSVWPPVYIIPFNPFHIPLLNTTVLLSSGASVTWAHHSMLEGNFVGSYVALGVTVVLGAYFTFLQGLEYMQSSFSIADSSYGSTFFLATGFHGIHVLVGSTFLLVCWFRMVLNHFSEKHHFGFEAAAWYWHFVDVVWLFLYVSIYWWGS